MLLDNASEIKYFISLGQCPKSCPRECGVKSTVSVDASLPTVKK